MQGTVLLSTVFAHLHTFLTPKQANNVRGIADNNFPLLILLLMAEMQQNLSVCKKWKKVVRVSMK